MRIWLIIVAVILPFIVALIFSPSISAYIIFFNIVTITTVYILLKSHNLINTRHFNYALLYILLISIFSIISFNSSVSIGSFANPYIPGGDGEEYFQTAKHLSYLDPLRDIQFFRASYFGYQVILSLLFKIFDVNLFIGLAFNYSLLVISIILISITSYMITNNKEISRFTLLFAMLTPQLFSFGTLLLKDIILVFSLSLFTIVSIKILYKKAGSWNIIFIILAIILVGITRFPYLFVLLFIFIILTNKFNFKQILTVLVLGVVFINILP